jgi:hypothetical protein
MCRKFAVLASLCASLSVGPGAGEADAYPIDCAILLCLAGGWPTSAPCAAAKAEFIRRITPWPIEPPLQIWRCPMGAAYRPGDDNEERIWDAAAPALAHGVPLMSVPVDPPEPYTLGIQRGPKIDRLIRIEGADIDISGPEFDFVRSIEVYRVDWWHHSHESANGDRYCRTYRSILERGAYSVQGEYSWSDLPSPLFVPDWMGFETSSDESCPYEGRFRAVGVAWRDTTGAQGFEVVTY